MIDAVLFEVILTAGGDSITLPVVGEVDLREMSILLSTILIALVDGFNPCSLWVLIVLIGLVSHAGRRKVVVVGLTFLLVTATIYGLFIAGLLSIFHYVAHLDAIRYGIAAFAIGFAVVSIKDYFAFGRWISFTIPAEKRPEIVNRARNAIRTEGMVSTVLVTGVFAGGIALIELPCTAGFPLIWSNLVVATDPSTAAYVSLLLVYILAYLSIEVLIFVTAIGTLYKFEYTEANAQLLKLFSGVLMLLLGSSIALTPDILESFSLILGVVIASILLTALIDLLARHRGLK